MFIAGILKKLKVSALNLFLEKNQLENKKMGKNEKLVLISTCLARPKPSLTKQPLSKLCRERLLLFPVDRVTYEFYAAFESSVFDAASLPTSFPGSTPFASNQSRGTLKCTTWGYFLCVASWLFRITWCSFRTCLSSRGKLTGRFAIKKTTPTLSWSYFIFSW